METCRTSSNLSSGSIDRGQKPREAMGWDSRSRSVSSKRMVEQSRPGTTLHEGRHSRSRCRSQPDGTLCDRLETFEIQRARMLQERSEERRVGKEYRYRKSAEN